MLLMPGKPPYSHAGGGDPAQNVRDRHFPYGFEKRGVAVPDGQWRFIWSHFPHYLKQKFHEVFVENALRMWTNVWRHWNSIAVILGQNICRWRFFRPALSDLLGSKSIATEVAG